MDDSRPIFLQIAEQTYECRHLSDRVHDVLRQLACE